MRTIYCPGIDRSVSLATYVRAVKLAKAHPHSEFQQGLTCWWSCTGSEIIEQFWQGVQDRINQAVPYVERGRPTAA
jgi:hypothetical protein